MFGGGSRCSDQHCHTASDLEVSMTCAGGARRQFSTPKNMEIIPLVVECYFSTGLWCQHTLLMSSLGVIGKVVVDGLLNIAWEGNWCYFSEKCMPK